MIAIFVMQFHHEDIYFYFSYENIVIYKDIGYPRDETLFSPGCYASRDYGEIKYIPYIDDYDYNSDNYNVEDMYDDKTDEYFCKTRLLSVNYSETDEKYRILFLYTPKEMEYGNYYYIEIDMNDLKEYIKDMENNELNFKRLKINAYDYMEVYIIKYYKGQTFAIIDEKKKVIMKMFIY
jgi:hypothetical protein